MHAGTLFYLEDMAKQEGLTPAGYPTTETTAEDADEGSGSGEGEGEEACTNREVGGSGGDDGSVNDSGGHGRPGVAIEGRLRRQSRERRAERYTGRLPLLDEVSVRPTSSPLFVPCAVPGHFHHARRLPLQDPLEDELPHLPPGEEHKPLAPLSPLGERLVGLVEWETDGIIRAQ